MLPLGVSTTECPRWLGPKGWAKRPTKGIFMPDACPCPATVSQAPREAPARRAPSSALYLEEKSDQQKKEEVGTGQGWPWGGHRVPSVALQFSSPTQTGTGASVIPLSVEELAGKPSRALKLTAASQETGDLGSRGRAERGPVLACPNPTRTRGFGPKCIWDPGAHLSL